MDIIIFLIALPLVISLILAVLPVHPLALRKTTGLIVNILLVSASVFLYLRSPESSVYYTADLPHSGFIMLGGELILALTIIVMSYRARKYYVIGLVLVQSFVMIFFEVLYGATISSARNLFIDRLSLIMALIIGVVGSLICNYAIGYITEYHEHNPGVKNRRRLFFFMFYLFLSSMFGLVFANNMIWMHFFWEITTFCSFILIGYKGDRESVDNAFRALWMNLLGGLAFSVAIFYSYSMSGVIEADRIIASGAGYAVIPAVLICFAGLVKSAQMPFSMWLTGAMVAPTPVSALLHSSTMVKAGVYVILRFAPALSGSPAALMISLAGAVTFLTASFAAVSQSNAKRVLAYSTISVLGLIVMCAGVNTHETVWAAILLIIFHAVTKSLLFLCVGVIEYKIGSKDIEDMDYLIMKMPKVAVMLNIGLAGMFLAPFGMLISKWVTLKAFVDYNPLFGIVLAFGSAATLFFYTKWMGKAITMEPGMERIEDRISLWEWSTLFLLTFMTVVVCIVFPYITSGIIEPYIFSLFGVKPVLDTFTVTVIVTVMVGLLVIVPLFMLFYSGHMKDYRQTGIYLSGANTDFSHYRNSFGEPVHADLRNYYLSEIFNEMKLLKTGIASGVLLLAIMFGVSLI